MSTALPEIKAIHLTGSVEIEAAAIGSKGPRAFTVKAYNGGELRLAEYPLPVVVDLSGMEQAPSITANLFHNKTQIVGHVTDTANDGKGLTMRGLASGGGEAKREFLQAHDDGYPWQASIEAQPGNVDEINKGQSVQVNGRQFVGPIFVARKPTLSGVAFLSRGADPGTHVQVAASHTGARVMAEITTPSDIQAERTRVADIMAVAQKFDLTGIRFGEYPTLEAAAVAQGWDGERTELEAHRAEKRKATVDGIRAELPRGPQIQAGNHHMSADVIEAALCQARGHTTEQLEKRFSEQVLDTAHRQFRGRFGLQQALIMAAHDNGFTCRVGDRLHAGNLHEILQYAFPPIHASAPTYANVGGILSNLANKELLLGYMMEDLSWQEISVVKSVNDFKQATSYRMLDNMEYEEVGPTGEIKHGTLGQESYTRQAKTYAKMAELTRVDIINDDLGAFDDMKNRLGRGAATKFNNVFWPAFMNNGSFFTSGRGNYLAGSTTNLGLDGVGMGLAVTAFRQLRSPTADGSKRLGMSFGGVPVTVVVPPELEFVADKLYVSDKVVAGGGSTTTTTPDDNVYKGKFKPVVVPWLSDTSITGNSTKAWYLFRKAQILAAMAVSFLNGNMAPTVESAQADFNILGIAFRGYHDFGCDQAEYLSGLKIKGES